MKFTKGPFAVIVVFVAATTVSRSSQSLLPFDVNLSSRLVVLIMDDQPQSVVSYSDTVRRTGLMSA
jgi:hypothetical protein